MDIINQPDAGFFERKSAMSLDDIVIEPIREDEADALANLIRRNLEHFEEAGNVLASTFRRIDHGNYAWMLAKSIVSVADFGSDLSMIGGADCGNDNPNMLYPML